MPAKMHLWIIQILLLVLIASLLSSCMQFRTNTKKVYKRFDARNLEVTVKVEKVEDREIRYILVNESRTDLPLIVFIHGATGSSDNFYQFMDDPDLVKSARMISVDRPGYGYSNFGKSLISIEEQARMINTIAEKYANDQAAIFIGHSYGGPIAAKCAIIDPKLVQSVVMLAPAIDPDNEKIFKIAYFGKIPPFRWITPRSWKVAVDEKLSHVVELQKMSRDWEQLQVPVVHIHGDRDRLVPFANLDFSKKRINSDILETIHIEGEDHFLPWSQKDLIREVIYDQLNKGSLARKSRE